MTSRQSPYGGGGFPPPWMSNSAKSDDDSGVEWGDDLPPREPDSGTQESFGLAWDEDGSAEAGAGFPAPASGYQGQGVQAEQFPAYADDDAPVVPTSFVEEPAPADHRPNDFNSILGSFSGAATASPDTKKAPRRPSPAPKVKQAKPEKPKRERAPRPKRGPRQHSHIDVPWKKVILAGATVVVLVVGGILGVNALTGKGDAGATASEVSGVSRAVAPGWSQSTSWTTPADIASTLSVRDGYIAYLNTAGVLVVVDDKNGETLFSSTPTGADPAKARVVVTQVGDTPVAAVVQGTSITAWALNQDVPAPKTNDIPSSASVSSGGSGIMMIANGETWRMNASLGMEKVEGLPKGNTSLGMTTSGSIITGSPQGGWGVNDGKATKAVTVQMAEGADGKVMYPTRASKGIVVAWAPTTDKNTRAVGIYNADSGAVIATAQMPTAQVNLGLPLIVADGGKLASAGSWLIDLERGETENVEGWGTTIGTTSELHGKNAGGKLVWRGSGAPETVPEGVAIPWGISSNDKAIIISNDESGRKVIAALNRG